jgi:ferredoxin
VTLAPLTPTRHDLLPGRDRRPRARRGWLLVAGLGLCLASAAVISHAQEHIQYERPVSAAPQPQDIGEGYTVPVVQFVPPRAAWREYTDVGVLVGALAMGTWLTVARRSRRGIWLLAAGSIAYFGFYRQGCVCPIGAIQNVTLALIEPRYVVSYITLAIFFLPLVVAVLFGRIYCGGVCPLGAIQELVALWTVQVPRRLDYWLGWLKWIFLAIVLYAVALPPAQREFLICKYDPFVGFYRFNGPLYMMLIGAGILVLGLFVGRPYCRWFCPYGALLSLLARLSWRSVSITPDKELDCGLCAEACPYGAIENLRAVRSTCLACARCYAHCPRERVRRGELPAEEPMPVTPGPGLARALETQAGQSGGGMGPA